MLTIFFIIVALAIVGFVVFVAMQPTDFTVTRAATLPVPASVVFAEVNDFHRWETWSPWAKMDPNAKNTFAGSPSGVGSIFTWEGKKVGAGKMTMLDSRPGEFIRIRLEFLKPFVATNIADFTFKPAAGNGTLVTWSMSGKNGFMGKAIGLFINCEKMCGSQFEEGLQNLREVTATETIAKY